MELERKAFQHRKVGFDGVRYVRHVDTFIDLPGHPELKPSFERGVVCALALYV